MNRYAATATLLAIASTAALPARAQHQEHDMSSMPGMKMPAETKPVPKPAVKPAVKKTPVRRTSSPTDPHAGMPGMDHGAMGHGKPPGSAKPAAKPARPKASPPAGTAPMTPSAMQAPASPPAAHGHDMSTMDHQSMDHGSIEHGTMQHGETTVPPAGSEQLHHMDHAGMPGTDHDADLPADAAPRTPIPPITAADRAAAFPPALPAHTTHGQMTHSFWLVDRLEISGRGDGGWEGIAWVGRDIDRLWLRTEGEVENGHVEDGNVEVLYGHSITPWWDVVAGIRQDVGEGPSRTYAAFGVQGLAPYKFEVEATGYLGNGGRTAATLEAEYDTLLTNRLILQWRGEATLYGRDDPSRGVGSGLSTVEAGARLRYEVTRKFSPYIGIEVERAFGNTADLRRTEEQDITETRVVAGIRFWF